MTNPIIVTIIFIFILGLIVGAIIKLALFYAHNKRMKAFTVQIEKRLNYLSSQMSSQVVDLQESMDVINNEYARLLNKMAKEDYKKGGLTKLTVDSLKKEDMPSGNIQEKRQSQAPVSPKDEA